MRYNFPGVVAVSMRKKFTIIGVSVAIAFLVTSFRYVHRGYLGVIESGESLRLIGHGPHFRAPWNRVTFYPIQSREMHLETREEGIEGKVEFDIVLLVSISPDSVISLHRAYGGAYMERLISPLIVDFLRQRGEDSQVWYGSSDCEKVGKRILQHLNSTLPDYGITIYRAWLRSFEVTTDGEGRSEPQMN
jgi:regulator of protease activity HflC (stomatin/prohibitin superfamily)